ncbi:hypothetical protein FOA52_002087 [Chlamydomonas sp. UWO 241]|nr:hypothetical protein FOA52_002087 [Chlamydomonas sp. UWO 241]
MVEHKVWRAFKHSKVLVGPQGIIYSIEPISEQTSDGSDEDWGKDCENNSAATPSSG